VRYLRLRAVNARVPNALTGRDITQEEYGEGVQVTPFILREVQAGRLVKAKRKRKKKTIKTPEFKEPIDG